VPRVATMALDDGEEVTIPCFVARDFAQMEVSGDVALEMGVLRTLMASLQRSHQALREEIASERAERSRLEESVTAAMQDVLSSVTAVGAKLSKNAEELCRSGNLAETPSTCHTEPDDALQSWYLSTESLPGSAAASAGESSGNFEDSCHVVPAVPPLSLGARAGKDRIGSNASISTPRLTQLRHLCAAGDFHSAPVEAEAVRAPAPLVTGSLAPQSVHRLPTAGDSDEVQRKASEFVLCSQVPAPPCSSREGTERAMRNSLPHTTTRFSCSGTTATTWPGSPSPLQDIVAVEISKELQALESRWQKIRAETVLLKSCLQDMGCGRRTPASCVINPVRSVVANSGA